ncbi:uncharacterized protein LOC128884311 isoform X2 [Hylaeus volcanicus]|uniref:uncharacterized protein LOC128884311 isoform X2 n=1 Tax=Hylaeus volcanicus TaxID=313075 RepID=UPI0023B82E21|nr:uncharacterized protein LOC128884311 isoform X2 [Hylaeus volcanicus]
MLLSRTVHDSHQSKGNGVNVNRKWEKKWREMVNNRNRSQIARNAVKKIMDSRIPVEGNKEAFQVIFKSRRSINDKDSKLRKFKIHLHNLSIRQREIILELKELEETESSKKEFAEIIKNLYHQWFSKILPENASTTNLLQEKPCGNELLEQAQIFCETCPEELTDLCHWCLRTAKRRMELLDVLTELDSSMTSLKENFEVECVKGCPFSQSYLSFLKEKTYWFSYLFHLMNSSENILSCVKTNKHRPNDVGVKKSKKSFQKQSEMGEEESRLNSNDFAKSHSMKKGLVTEKKVISHDSRDVWTVQGSNSLSIKKKKTKGAKNTNVLHKPVTLETNNKKEKLTNNKCFIRSSNNSIHCPDLQKRQEYDSGYLTSSTTGSRVNISTCSEFPKFPGVDLRDKCSMSDQTLSSYNEFLKSRYAKYGQHGTADNLTKGLPFFRIDDSDVVYEKMRKQVDTKTMTLESPVEKIVENYVPVNIHKGLMNGIFDKKKIDLSLHVHTDGHAPAMFINQMKNIGDRNNFVSVDNKNGFHYIPYNNSDMIRSQCEPSQTQSVSYPHAESQDINERTWKGMTYDTTKAKSFEEQSSFENVKEQRDMEVLPPFNGYATSFSTHQQHGFPYDFTGQTAGKNTFTSLHTGSASAREMYSNENIKENPHLINLSQVNEHKTSTPSVLEAKIASSQALKDYYASLKTENPYASPIYKTNVNSALDSSKNAYSSFQKNSRFSNSVQASNTSQTFQNTPQTFQNTPCSWKSVPQSTYSASVSPGNSYLKSFNFTKGYSGSLSPGNTYSTVESPNRHYSSCTETEKYASQPLYQNTFATPHVTSPKSHPTIFYAKNQGFHRTPVSYEYSPCLTTPNRLNKQVTADPNLYRRASSSVNSTFHQKNLWDKNKNKEYKKFGNYASYYTAPSAKATGLQKSVSKTPPFKGFFSLFFQKKTEGNETFNASRFYCAS